MIGSHTPAIEWRDPRIDWNVEKVDRTVSKIHWYGLTIACAHAPARSCSHAIGWVGPKITWDATMIGWDNRAIGWNIAPIRCVVVAIRWARPMIRWYGLPIDLCGLTRRLYIARIQSRGAAARLHRAIIHILHRAARHAAAAVSAVLASGRRGRREIAQVERKIHLNALGPQL